MKNKAIRGAKHLALRKHEGHKKKKSILRTEKLKNKYKEGLENRCNFLLDETNTL